MKDGNAFSGVLVEVDWDFDALPALHCPITGQIVAIGYDPETGDFFDAQREPKWETIPTMLFHYYPEAGELRFFR